MARLLRMPEVAANAVEAVLSEWPVPENTRFAAQDAIATVETEKAVVDVPADSDGVILRTLVAAGSVVEVGAPIALLGDPGEVVGDLGALLISMGVAPGVAADPSLSAPGVAPDPSLSAPGVAPDPSLSAPVATQETAAASRPPVVAAQATASSSGTGPAAEERGGRIFSSPLARRLAREAGLSITDLSGTGPGGRVVRRDVQQATDARDRWQGDTVTAQRPGDTAMAQPPGDTPAVTPAVAPAAYEDIAHTPMRRAIAARLSESTRDAPHFFVRGTARVDKLLRLRARLNDSGPVRVSINDLVVAAAARAHVLVPAMNVIWTPDAVRIFSGVDISIAVATDRGLVTPVLRGVDQMTLSAIASASSDLVGRARSGRLRQDELEGGTLTVTNLGGFGTEEFAAIINPPQSAVLAIGAARGSPVVKKGRLKVGTVMSATLSVDHRPIDGVVAAQWMAAFLSLLEEPVRILM